MKGKKILNRPWKKKNPGGILKKYLFCVALLGSIGILAGACCPIETHEAEKAVSAQDPATAGPVQKSIQTKTLVSNDEISRSAESEIFLIVDAKHRSTGSDQMPRRKLNRKKYVSIRAKGGDAQ